MSAYSDSDFVIDFYKQGEEIQADLYRVRGGEPCYDLIDEITVGLRGEFGPDAIERVINSWNKISAITFKDLEWGEAAEPVIVPIGQPYRSRHQQEIYTVSVRVSYDFLESVS